MLLVTEKAKLIVQNAKVLAYCQPSVMNAKARASCRLLPARDQLNATYAPVVALSRTSAKSALAAGDLLVRLAAGLETHSRLDTTQFET